MFNYQDREIKIVEVGPRDGLQNEKAIVGLEDKLKYIQLLAKTGLKTIEVTSFVRSEKIPQMADAGKLFKELNRTVKALDISFPCLVPNLQGYKNAKEAGVKEISLFSATSDEFTKKNINCTVDESFIRMSDVAREAKKDGVKVRGYISTAFGCPYMGDVGVSKLVSVVEKFLDLGAEEISIGDTIGIANPKQVDRYLKTLNGVIDFKKLALHFHDTRGMAIANTLVGLENDISIYDSSSGGLGGCPYANGATGNVATEDLLYLFHSLGLETGINLEKVLVASKFILEKVRKSSPSKYIQSLK